MYIYICIYIYRFRFFFYWQRMKPQRICAGEYNNKTTTNYVSFGRVLTRNRFLGRALSSGTNLLLRMLGPCFWQGLSTTKFVWP